MSRPITVWTEIPVTDMTRACDFYAKVFDYEMKVDDSGPDPMAVFNGAMDTAGGHLYPGTPAGGAGNTVHLALACDLETGIARCAEAGGEVLSPPISIPSGRFVYARDSEGNSIGLFEPAAA